MATERNKGLFVACCLRDDMTDNLRAVATTSAWFNPGRRASAEDTTNNMTTPTIKIEGMEGSGKSALAYAIENALSELGVQCELTGCEDEKPGVLWASWKDRLSCLKTKTITIETIQTKCGYDQAHGTAGERNQPKHTDPTPKKKASKAPSTTEVDRAAHGSALVSAAGEMLKVAARIQEIAAALERECDQAKCERKYGKGLIRVDWQYTHNAFRNPTLKHVCTWANGDEGFVPNDPHQATASDGRPQT